MMVNKIERGQVYLADLPQSNNIQGGRRPVLIVQNNKGNLYSPNLIICTITSKIGKRSLQTHVRVSQADGMEKESDIQTESILTISKENIVSRCLCKLSDEKMKEVNKAICLSLAI